MCELSFIALEGLKRGICPIPLPVDACEEETDNECTLDSDCFGDRKCCSDSCQKLCVKPPQSKLATLKLNVFICSRPRISRGIKHHRGQTSEAFFVLFSGISFNIKWKHRKGE